MRTPDGQVVREANFEVKDVDGDDRLDPEEFALRRRDSPEESQALFERIDGNGDGVLSFGEHGAAQVGRMFPGQAFRNADLDSDELLDEFEYSRACRADSRRSPRLRSERSMRTATTG